MEKKVVVMKSMLKGFHLKTYMTYFKTKLYINDLIGIYKYGKDDQYLQI